MGFEGFLNLTGGLANLATTIGIIVGGGWVAWRFRASRQSFPRADLKHQLASCATPDGSVLLRVVVIITNSGTVALQVEDVLVRLQQILPCDPDVIRALTLPDTPRPEGDWPSIGEKREANAQCIIEAGENQLFEFHFVIPKQVEAISVYSHVANKTMKGRGWDSSTWHKCEDLSI